MVFLLELTSPKNTIRKEENEMHFKTYLLVALVLILAIGMGCGGNSSTSSGGGGNSIIVGTWTLVSQTPGHDFPIRIVFNSDGSGSFTLSNGFNEGISWSLDSTGTVVTINLGGTIDLTSVVNTFTLVYNGATATYYRV
jgi:hypothetical protein